MKLRAIHVIFLILLLSLSSVYKAQAQIPTSCFEIESILVDACGSPEGENEMFRFQVGPAPINSANLTITWPSNSFLGFCTDQTKLDALNATIGGCGWLLAPPGGIIPAGKQVLVITSTNMNVAFNSFANLSDTLYVLFQCAGNTNGHFANYSTSGASQGRTLIMKDNSSGCSDTVTYMKNLLINQSGNHSATNGDGAGANFDYAGNITYYNNGCNAPFVAPSINAGNDTTYNICIGQPVIILHGSKSGSFRSTRWEGGNGTFSQPDSLTTIYTPSPSDVSPIQLSLVGKLCPDTLVDVVNITIIPPFSVARYFAICQGNSLTVGTHTYTTTNIYHDTLTTASGCDSIIETHLTVIPVISQSLVLSGCDNVVYKGVTYTTNASFQDTLRGSFGCDSIHYSVTIMLTHSTAYQQTIALCQGQSITVGTNVHSTAGTYTDVLTNAAGCDSTVTTVLSYTVSTIDAGPNTSICNGDSTQLNATGGLTYAWLPTTGLSNPAIANPIAKPTVTTTYTVTSSIASANQIINGDFSSGNTGFSSSYTYSSPSNTAEGQYIVSANAQSWNGGMASCGDHTTGSGNMLVVNGATTANVTIYCQTVNVVPNTDYAFSTWLQSVTASNPAQLQFSINSALVGSIFTAQPNNCDWRQFYTTWNSGTNISAQICIVNQNTVASGNDFALDDISFAPLCTGTDTVQIVVNPTYRDTVTATICRSNAPYTLPNGTSVSATGSYTSALHTVNNCDSIIVTKLTVDTVVNQTITLPAACGQLTYNGTTYTSSTSVNETLHYQNGCDSVAKTTNIVVNPIPTFSQSPVVCQGQSFTAGSHTYTSGGTYRDTITGGSSLGCDSIVTTTLTVIVPVTSAETISGTCSITYRGITYTSAASLIDTAKSQATGCDSSYHTINITVAPVVPVTNPTVNACINPGQSYFAGGQNQTTAGTYRDTVRTPGGCDSTYTITNLQLVTPSAESHRVDSCNRATINGVVYTDDTILLQTISSALGCDSIIRTDSIMVHSATSISISSSEALPLIEGDSTMLTISPSGTYHNLVWSPDSNISSIGAASPTVSPTRTTTYYVAAADSNNCSVSASIIIQVDPNTQLDFIMPTAFSPNGDGNNELFKAILRKGAELVSFRIYNRWGERVYDKDVDNSDGWDGLYKNVAQPIGVYVYFISVKGVAGNMITQQGNLTLIR